MVSNVRCFFFTRGHSWWLLALALLGKAVAHAQPSGIAAETTPDVRTDAAENPVPLAATPPRLPDNQHAHPAYPAAGDGHAARVLLELTIGADGKVSSVTVLEVDRPAEQARHFARAAVDFAQSRSFIPATQAGIPTSARVQLEVLFQPGEHSHQHEQALAPHGHAHEDKQAAAATQGPKMSSKQEFGALASVQKRYLAASAGDVEGEALRLRPFSSTGDLLNGAGGLYAVQHAGGGKANQYFLRGFDADHGTDVALSVDGVPENQVSHGHGQGYTALHWLIPELIERMEVRKGPYWAEYGDFATAGALNLVMRSRIPNSSVSFGGGTYGTFRGLGILAPQQMPLAPILAAEIYGSQGPFEHGENLRRMNLFGRVSHPWSNGSTLTITLSGHVSGWEANGQLPLREVARGRLDRFGTLDPNEGGSTHRHGLVAHLRVPEQTSDDEAAGPMGDDDGLELTAFLTYHRFALYSNFTFYSRDADLGDMIRQGDERMVGGLRSAYRTSYWLGPVRTKSHAGIQLRVDDIHTSLDATPGRRLVASWVDADVDESSLGVFAEQAMTWKILRGSLGIRADYFGFNVRNATASAEQATMNDGERQAMLISPKANVMLSPTERLDLFANAGFGFHSNDARGIVRRENPAQPLNRARGIELGASWRPSRRAVVEVAAFAIDLESETVWIGDEGTTEAGDATRRVGVELQARVPLLPFLRLDLDATFSHARYRDAEDGDAIPLAPTFMLDAGLIAEHRPTGLSGRLGCLVIGNRAATPDGFLTAEGFYRLDATVQWEQERFTLALQVLNLTDVTYRMAQFATTSRLPNETSADSCPSGTRAQVAAGEFVGCEDVHFTPGWPLHITASASLHF